MGERDLSREATAVSRPPRHLAAPVMLLALLILLGLARPPRPPVTAAGVSHLLGAASVGRDLDLSFEAEDLDRFRDLVQTESLAVLLSGDPDATFGSYPGNPLGLLWVAPFAGAGGLRGAQLAHSLALVLAMGMAATTLRQRLDSVWRILLLCLFASAAIHFWSESSPALLTLAAVVAAFALAYRGETPRFEELPEVFDRRSAGLGSLAALRWLAVGALLGFAAVSHPLYLLLVLPAVLALPVAARRSGGVAIALGLAMALGTALAAALLLGAEPPWMARLALFTPAGGFPGLGGGWADGDPVPSILATARPVVDVSLFGWNLLFVAAGRSLGALPYFLPVVLLLALWEPRSKRSALVATAALAAAVSVVLWPFDYAGQNTGFGGSVGNALLLPFFGALWLVPTRRTSLLGPVAVTALAGVLLWPAWLDGVGLWRGGTSVGSLVTPAASRWLPHESSLRPVGADFLRLGELAVLPAGGGVEERRGRLFLNGGRWGSVVVASPRPLERVHLAFDGQAGSELEVAGGRLGRTLFRGDGGVGFEVELDGTTRRHRMWWSATPQNLYDLRLRLPKAPRVPVAFGIEGESAP